MMDEYRRAIDLITELNGLMTKLPHYRIQSQGTRAAIREANGHFYDPGLDCVAEFARAFRVQVCSSPGFPDEGNPLPVDQDLEAVVRVMADLGRGLKALAAKHGGNTRLARLQLIQEELAELAEGLLNHDIVECFDALLDLSYVVDGTYLTLGLGAYKLEGQAEVHRSNMSKLGQDGKPIVCEAGRVVKGPNFSKPDLEIILREEA